VDLHNFSPSPDIIRVIGHKLRQIKWGMQVEQMAGMKYAYNILIGNVKGRRNLITLGVDARIILKQMLRRKNVKE
jgi:hypothetical protein